MDFVREIYGKIEGVTRTVKLLQRGLVRLGTVLTVDTTACTVVIAFPGTDASGAPNKSHPMPWLQRSSEHRPPAVGDHAVVLDPSLGMGAAIAITGWPSTARPSPGGIGEHVLYAGTDKAKVASPDVELGVGPTQFAALSNKVDAELGRIWNVLTGSAGTPPWNPVGTLADAGALKTAAASARTSVQSVAAAQVKVK